MRLHQVVLLGLAASLFAAGCHAGLQVHGATVGQEQSLGALIAPEAPPPPMDPYFTEKPGEVWVHGRWAWMTDQWVWQAGYYQPAQHHKVYVAGRWERKNGQYQWMLGKWQAERVGFTFAPGHYDYRGSCYVWMLDRWEQQEPGKTWVAGRWITDDKKQWSWVDGHWVDKPGFKKSNLWFPPRPLVMGTIWIR